jgi:hypothetical protein
LVVQRIGQGIFRARLMDYRQGCCPLTGISDPALLRASHIIPWADCESDAERLDVHNGLLLSALWDAAFDAGLVALETQWRCWVAAGHALPGVAHPDLTGGVAASSGYDQPPESTQSGYRVLAPATPAFGPQRPFRAYRGEPMLSVLTRGDIVMTIACSFHLVIGSRR